MASGDTNQTQCENEAITRGAATPLVKVPIKLKTRVSINHINNVNT